ncbi:hypothetical protein F2Q70_00042046 [Brassica cretica]|uniref:Zinc knuckle CX2CX4HX4C domain-containing protein n=1 Tax=Brassica cretica TaxID=69181 RepID=A0A8S9MMB2_BRACR|nr:hypothetical protein F2Q70_00042046 [Brassica cretica]KAF2619298.1 hypothetical protein F2Q68_00042733 [Brassica cretica]
MHIWTWSWIHNLKNWHNKTSFNTDEGDVITVEASYLRLPRVCSHCRIVGHRESACETINHSSSDKVQGNGNISVSLEESQVHTTGPLIAEPQKVTSTPEIIIAPTETDVLEKNATNDSLQETTPATNIGFQLLNYAVQFETTVKTSVSPSKAKEFESSPSASPLEGNDTMENNSLHRDDTLTPQTSFSTEVTTVAKPSVFGDLFDKNGGFHR